MLRQITETPEKFDKEVLKQIRVIAKSGVGHVRTEQVINYFYKRNIPPEETLRSLNRLLKVRKIRDDFSFLILT